MDGETRDLMIEAVTYAWREHCGVRGEDTGSQWPAHERVARSLLGGLERHGYTIVPPAQLAEAHATIAALRAALLGKEYAASDYDGAKVCPWCGADYGREHSPGCEWKAALAQPIPPAAKRLLALSTLLEDRAWWATTIGMGTAIALLAAINARLEEGV